MEYLTTAEFAEKWGISQRRVGIYCKEGRLEGAMIKGKTWLIPADVKKPDDPRRVRKEENSTIREGAGDIYGSAI